MITRDRDAKRYPVNVPRASVPGYVRVIYALCFLAVLRPDYVVGRFSRPGRLEPVYKGAEGEQRGGGRAQARENAHAAVEAIGAWARRIHRRFITACFTSWQDVLTIPRHSGPICTRRGERASTLCRPEAFAAGLGVGARGGTIAVGDPHRWQPGHGHREALPGSGKSPDPSSRVLRAAGFRERSTAR